MIILLLGALALAGVSAALVLRAVALPRMRASETVGQIESYGYSSRQRDKAASGPVRGILDGVANAVGGVMAHRLGGLREAELRNELMAAGLYTLAPRKFLGYRILCAVCVPAAVISTGSERDHTIFRQDLIAKCELPIADLLEK